MTRARVVGHVGLSGGGMGGGSRMWFRGAGSRGRVVERLKPGGAECMMVRSSYSVSEQ